MPQFKPFSKAETSMSSSLAQCIAPLFAQYHQIVLVPLPRSSQDGLEPMPALPLSALAGAALSAATIYDMRPAVDATTTEGRCERSDVEPNAAAASSGSEQASRDEDAYLDSMLTALAQRKRPSRARLVSIPLVAVIEQAASVDGDCSDSRGPVSAVALDNESSSVRIGSSFAALMHSVLGAHSTIAWVYELMRAGFAAERASLWIICVSDELLLEVASVSASASSSAASIADGSAWHSILENAAALAAPGSRFLLVRQRNGECSRGSSSGHDNGVSDFERMSRHVAALLSVHQFSIVPPPEAAAVAAPISSLDESSMAVALQFEIIVALRRDAQ
jgi:hypothetical protein